MLFIFHSWHLWRSRVVYNFQFSLYISMICYLLPLLQTSLATQLKYVYEMSFVSLHHSVLELPVGITMKGDA